MLGMSKCFGNEHGTKKIKIRGKKRKNVVKKVFQNCKAAWMSDTKKKVYICLQYFVNRMVNFSPFLKTKLYEWPPTMTRWSDWSTEQTLSGCYIAGLLSSSCSFLTKLIKSRKKISKGCWINHVQLSKRCCIKHIDFSPVQLCVQRKSST